MVRIKIEDQVYYISSRTIIRYLPHIRLNSIDSIVHNILLKPGAEEALIHLFDYLRDVDNGFESGSLLTALEDQWKLDWKAKHIHAAPFTSLSLYSNLARIMRPRHFGYSAQIFAVLSMFFARHCDTMLRSSTSGHWINFLEVLCDTEGNLNDALASLATNRRLVLRDIQSLAGAAEAALPPAVFDQLFMLCTHGHVPHHPGDHGMRELVIHGGHRGHPHHGPGPFHPHRHHGAKGCRPGDCPLLDLVDICIHEPERISLDKPHRSQHRIERIPHEAFPWNRHHHAHPLMMMH